MDTRSHVGWAIGKNESEIAMARDEYTTIRPVAQKVRSTAVLLDVVPPRW